MFFSLNEIVLWIGLTLFEIWINLVSVTIFSVLLALKIDGILSGSWMSLYNSLKISLYRASWSTIFLGLTFVFKFLLCKKLTGQSTIEYSEVFAPLFILLQFIAVRACQLHTT